MKKKKLLVLSSTYPRWDNDWEPAFVHELSKRLTDEFDVSVLCPREKGSKSKELKDQVSIHRYSYAPNLLSTLVSNGGIASNLKSHPLKWLLVPLFFLFQTLAILTAIKRDKPDVIHCHWIIPQGICLYIAKLLSRSKTPHLLTSHGGDLYTFRGKLLSKLKKRVINNADCITVVSQAMKKEVNRIAGQEVDISVIPMGIETKNTFYPDPNIERSKTEILFVGRLVEKKGVKYLLEAFAVISQTLPDASLTIIGEGPERTNLETLAHTLRIKEKVRFKGAVVNKELPNYYRRAAVFVAPFITAKNGDQEGFGLVVVEALSCECPVILTTIEASEDTRTIYSNSDQLIPITPESSSEMAKAFTHVLTREQSSIIKNHTDKIRDTLDWVQISRRYMTLLKMSI
ncbi:glycosyltransferase [Zhongshania borealis]|uniref:Glycosyltransferase family 4 protein n=1 Tax=Zhongshania borealis TaxID=889488 RepID=A0ABP7X2L7_9GAMM